MQPGVQPSILSPLWAHLLGLSAHLGSPQLLSLRAGPTGKHVSVEKVYRSLGPLLQENSFLLPKPGQVAFLLGLTLQEEKTRLRRLDCEWPGSTGSQSSQEPLPFLSPLVSFPCKQDPKQVVSLPRPSCRLRWVREPSSLNKQQGCLPGPSLCTPQPLALQENLQTPQAAVLPLPGPEFQPPESSPGVPPPTTALTELLLGGRGSPRDRGYSQGRHREDPCPAKAGQQGPRYAVWGVI